MEDLETSAALAFHGVAYVVTVAVERQELLLQVEVEDPAATVAPGGGNANAGSSAGDCWTARFPAAYIEELTRKTGNYKRFQVFVSMLLSALAHRSDAVFVDLLTAADLELYRKRKMGKAGAGSDAFGGLGTGGNSSKRYLILTYAVEFDRVHYPLPLALVQSPTPDVLQRTIRRLRQALAAKNADPHNNRGLAEENATLREENRCLKSTLKQYCAGSGVIDAENVDPACNPDMKSLYTAASSTDLRRELEASIEENKELLEIYQRYREESAQESARLKAEIRQLKMANLAGDDDERASLVSLKQAVEQERSDARRKLRESSDTMEETLVRMVEMKATLDETQLKNRELMRQVAILRAKENNRNEMLSKATGSPMTGRRPANTTQQPRRQPRTAPTRGRDGTLRGGAMQQEARRPSSGYRSSDDERESTHSSTECRSSYNLQRSPGQQRRGFRRFDPTAYQLEKERKQQQQHRSRSPAVRSTAERQDVSSNRGGYASDSSVGGGYSSADSRGSNTSSRSTRSRGRASARRQREIDARLASPKRTAATESELPPRFRSPLPRSGAIPSPSPQVRSTSRGRSPSPARSIGAARGDNRSPAPAPSAASLGRGQSPRLSNGMTANRKLRGGNITATDGGVNATRGGSPVTHPATAPAAQRQRQQQQQQQQQQQKLQQKQRALLLDTSMDSFSDIDDRLTALQQFLKEAKQGTGNTGSTATGPSATPTATPSSR